MAWTLPRKAGNCRGFTRLSFEEVLWFMNVLGLFAFGLSGALRAIEENLDLLGLVALGLTCALGGGIIRDIMLSELPRALKSELDVLVALIASLSAIVLKHIKPVSSVLPIADAVGLSAFSTTGAILASSAGVSPFGVVILATITGAGGGFIADLMLNRVPTVLKEDFYASCSILGAIVFLISMQVLSPTISALLCWLCVLLLRLFAILFRWRLPRLGQSG
ncbi:MAG: trimeric intracellular cation channel family protein [Aquificaceae bacterium]|nr:trimeric intracellular cation channel family protein [Aquificaceae bacterium]